MELYKLYEKGTITEHELLNRLADLGVQEVPEKFKIEYAKILEMRKQSYVSVHLGS